MLTRLRTFVGRPLMAQESSRPRIGEGRIGSSLCAAIGVLSVAAVLCLRYPAFFTTPELRVHYDVELLRLTLAVAMVVGAWRHRDRAWRPAGTRCNRAQRAFPCHAAWRALRAD